MRIGSPCVLYARRRLDFGEGVREAEDIWLRQNLEIIRKICGIRIIEAG